MNKAIVLSVNSGNFFIKDLNTNERFIAKLKGTLKDKNTIYAGDIINYINDNSTVLITDVSNRKNNTIRPKISNIDNLFIVQSIVEPSFNISQMFKYHTFYKTQQIKNIYFIITKIDICEQSEKHLFFLRNKYKLNIIDSNNDNDIKKLKTIFKNNINCFVGQSGVGKSTLLNKIIPSLNIKTNEISKILNRGKHTTTTTTLYEYGDAYIVDTPGFSTIDINISKEELAKIFFNFDELYNNCKFSNCLHKNEKDCFIKSAINKEDLLNESIYNEYIKLSDSLKK